MTYRRSSPCSETPGDPAAPPTASSQSVDVIRSEERLRTGVQRVPVERVRVSTRLVTETRTVTVQVQREKLVVERVAIPAGGDADVHRSHPTAKQGEPVVEMVLREEVPEVLTRVVPVERVRVYVDRVAGTEQVSAAVRREEVELTDSRDASAAGAILGD